MNKLTIALLFAAAALPGMASAQDGHHDDHHGGGEHAREGGGQPRPAPQAQPQAQQRPQAIPGGQGLQPRPRGFDTGGQFQRPQNTGGGQPGRPPAFQNRGGYDGRHFDRDRGPFTAGQPAPNQPRAFQNQPNIGRGSDDGRRRFDRGQGFDSQAQGGFHADRGRPGYNGQLNAYGARGGDPYRDGGFRGRGEGYRPDYDRGQWNRGWRGDNRYNWNSYRRGHYDLFRLPRYSAPYGYGYGYQRFGIGVTLNELLFSQDYWIDNPYEYRLPPVDGPYRWVRYYNDALLVDLYSGEVVDVVYGIFY